MVMVTVIDPVAYHTLKPETIELYLHASIARKCKTDRYCMMALKTWINPRGGAVLYTAYVLV